MDDHCVNIFNMVKFQRNAGNLHDNGTTSLDSF